LTWNRSTTLRLLAGFRGECGFRTWLYRVTCSVCLTELGRRERRAEVELTQIHLDRAAPAPKSATDLPELVRRCVPKLPARYAAIMTLYYLEEVPYEDITRFMDIPMGTLKTWMHRARRRLRKIVEAELAGGVAADAAGDVSAPLLSMASHG